MADLQKIVDDLSSLTVLEAAELAKMLEEKWGVSAAAAVAVAAPGAAGGGAGAAPGGGETRVQGGAGGCRPPRPCPSLRQARPAAARPPLRPRSRPSSRSSWWLRATRRSRPS